MTLEELTPAALGADWRRRVEVHPNLLPVQNRAWTTVQGMGIDTGAGNHQFVDDGTHVWEAFRQHWGWWKTQILGWYPYTDLRDYWRHNLTGEGRPWLRILPEDWQELVFRELVLLVELWNKLVVDDRKYLFAVGQDEPEWMGIWLTLTNEVWRRGASDVERGLLEALRSPEFSAATVEEFKRTYLRSSLTWRPMMPERAVFHRKHMERPEYWTFERSSE